jgi:hypothetical protein
MTARWVFVFLMFMVSVAQAQDAPPACSSEEYRQFDFWIGEWDVTQNGKPAGTNRITAILDGCVLMEQWESANGKFSGRSFNRYDATTGQWEQLWVDNKGSVLRLRGSYNGGRMVLEGVTPGPDGDIRNRITWHNNADGTVRQVWEKSKDGAEWNTVFDGLYVRK